MQLFAAKKDSFAKTRRRQRHRLFKVALILFFGAGLAAACVVFTLRQVREMRARTFAREAAVLLADGKLREAMLNAESFWRLRPGDPEALRLVARILDRAGESQALDFYRQLDSAGAMSGEDRWDYARAALRAADWPLVAAQAASFAAAGETARAELLEACYLSAHGDNAAAIEKFRRAVQAGGGDEARAGLVNVLLAAKPQDPVIRDELQRHLEILAVRDDKMGAEALAALLAGDLAGSHQQRDELWGRLRAHPAVTDDMLLTVESARLAKNSAGREETLQRVFDFYFSLPPERRAAAARWLNQLGAHERALRLVSREDALGGPDVFTTWIEALVGSGKLQAADEALAGNQPLPRALTLLYRGKIKAAEGKDESSTSFYRAALTESASSPLQFPGVVGFLRQQNKDGLLEAELPALLSRSTSAKAALETLVPMLQRRRDAEAILEACTAASAVLPNNAALRGDKSYLEAVLGRGDPLTETSALVAQYPDDLSLRLVHAFALAQAGRAKDAAELLGQDRLPFKSLLPHQQAMAAIVFAAAGRPQEVEKLAASINRSFLTRQEEALLRKHFSL